MNSARMVQALILLLTALSCTVEKKGNAMNFGDAEMGVSGTDAKVQLGWSASGTLLAKNNLANQFNDTQVSMQAQFPEPGVYTVQASVELPDGLVAVRPVAEVEWSVGGNTIRRRFSVGQGASISAPAEGVRVTIKDEAALLGGVNTEYRVAMTVCRGLRPSSSRPTLTSTEGAQVIFAGATQTYVIPKKSGAVAVSIAVSRFTGDFAMIPDQTVQARQRSADGNVVATCDPRQFEFWSLEPNAVQVDVYNYSALENIWVNALFAIDG